MQRTIYHLLTLICLLNIGYTSFSQQLDFSYLPEPVVLEDESEEELVEDFRKSEQLKIKQQYKDKGVRNHILDAIENREESFLAMLEDGDLMLSGKLADYVQGVLDRIIDASDYGVKAKAVIVRRESPNAFNAGDNYVFIHLGLLARLTSEDELAFVLAHELAHNMENHFLESVEAYAMLAESDSINRRIKEIRRTQYGHVSAMNKLMIPWILSNKKESRTHEYDADNLAFDWTTKAGYSPENAIAIFDVLGYAEFERDTVSYNLTELLYLDQLGEDFEEALSPEYGSSLGTFEVEKDTLEDLLRTHPFSKDRKGIFEDKVKDLRGSVSTVDQYAQIRYMAEVEILALTIFNNDIDRTILYGLSIIRDNPDHYFAKHVLPLCFAYLGRSKDRRQMGKLVGIHSNDYDDVYNELIFFLRKISPDQSIKIAKNLATEYGFMASSKELNAMLAIFDFMEENMEDFELRLSTERQKPSNYYSVHILETIINQ